MSSLQSALARIVDVLGPVSTIALCGQCGLLYHTQSLASSLIGQPRWLEVAHQIAIVIIVINSILQIGGCKVNVCIALNVQIEGRCRSSSHLTGQTFEEQLTSRQGGCCCRSSKTSRIYWLQGRHSACTIISGRQRAIAHYVISRTAYSRSIGRLRCGHFTEGLAHSDFWRGVGYGQQEELVIAADACGADLESLLAVMGHLTVVIVLTAVAYMIDTSHTQVGLSRSCCSVEEHQHQAVDGLIGCGTIVERIGTRRTLWFRQTDFQTQPRLAVSAKVR